MLTKTDVIKLLVNGIPLLGWLGQVDEIEQLFRGRTDVSRTTRFLVG